MRTLAWTAAALGLVGAIAAGTTVPVMAAGIYFNGHGVHVHFGHHRHYYDRYGGGGWNTYNGCPPGYTIQGGNCAPSGGQRVGAINAQCQNANRGRPS